MSCSATHVSGVCGMAYFSDYTKQPPLLRRHLDVVFSGGWCCCSDDGQSLELSLRRVLEPPSGEEEATQTPTLDRQHQDPAGAMHFLDLP